MRYTDEEEQWEEMCRYEEERHRQREQEQYDAYQEQAYYEYLTQMETYEIY